MEDSILVHCSKCNQDKPETDFYRLKTGKLKHPCKECVKADNKAKYVPKRLPSPPPGQKRCPHCHQIFASTTEFFYSAKGSPSGLSALCKVCHRVYERSRHDRPKLILETRICRICKQEKPASPEFFERMKANNYGLNTICKACMTAARYKPSPYEPAPLGYKRCRQCFEVKPATPEFFRAEKQAKGSLRNQCRECRKSYRKKPLPYKPRKRKPVPTGDKQCIGCKQFFPRTREYFFFARQAVDRLQSRCKKCYRKQGTERRRALPAEERSRRSRITVLNRIARKKAVQGSYTFAQIAEQLKRQKYHCYYAACGFAKFPRVKENGTWKYIYHVEHTFPLSRVAGTDIPANDMGYLVLACVHCNSSKGNKFPWEWPEGGRLL